MEKQARQTSFAQIVISLIGPTIMCITFIYKFGSKDAEIEQRVSQLERQAMTNVARMDMMVERQLEEKEKVWSSIYEIRVMLQDKQNRQR